MLNQIFNEDCLLTMARMPDNYVYMILTSPPYGLNRNYKGFTFKIEDWDTTVEITTSDAELLERLSTVIIEELEYNDLDEEEDAE